MSNQDNTFVKFTAEQAAAYASGRGTSYAPKHYETILEYHEGSRDLLLDVGTGPGKVVFDLMPNFAAGVGCDLSPHMIDQAKKDASARGFAENVKFVVCSGEQCADALTETGHSAADVVTIAMALHWMDAPKLYNAAAKALRPGGTLAAWTCSSIFVHPSTPNAKVIQETLDDLEHNILRPYMSTGNIASGKAYEDMALPWTNPDANPGFEETSFVRKDWDRNGIPSAPPNADGSAGPFLKHIETRMTDLEKGMGSSNAVIRWREAHPDKANTAEDPVKLTLQKLQDVSGGSESLVLSPSSTLLLMRRSEF